jgi:hypothetical protein
MTKFSSVTKVMVKTGTAGLEALAGGGRTPYFSRVPTPAG